MGVLDALWQAGRPGRVREQVRRLGVELGNPAFAVPKGGKLFQVDAEENLPEVVKTQDIAKAVIK